MKRNQSLIITIIILAGLIAGVLVVHYPQLFQKRAAYMCPVDGASCSWDSLGSDVSYTYEIDDITANAVVSKGTTSATAVNFTPFGLHSYRCLVTPVNSCGAGPVSSVETECNTIVTPTPNSVGGVGGPEVAILTETPVPTEMLTEYPIPTDETPQDLITATPSSSLEVFGTPDISVETTPATQSSLEVQESPVPTENQTLTDTLSTGSKITAYTGIIVLIIVVLFWIWRIIIKRRRDLRHSDDQKK